MILLHLRLHRAPKPTRTLPQRARRQKVASFVVLALNPRVLAEAVGRHGCRRHRCRQYPVLIAIGIACVVACSIGIVSVRPTAAGVSVCIAVVGTVNAVTVVVGVGTSFAVSVIASIVLARFVAAGADFVCVAIVSAVGTGVVLT